MADKSEATRVCPLCRQPHQPRRRLADGSFTGETCKDYRHRTMIRARPATKIAVIKHADSEVTDA